MLPHAYCVLNTPLCFFREQRYLQKEDAVSSEAPLASIPSRVGSGLLDIVPWDLASLQVSLLVGARAASASACTAHTLS